MEREGQIYLKFIVFANLQMGRIQNLPFYHQRKQRKEIEIFTYESQYRLDQMFLNQEETLCAIWIEHWWVFLDCEE